MQKPFYVINAAQDSDTAEILIYKPINSDWNAWFLNKEDITAQNFVSEFKKLEDNYKNIHIRINSPGGYVFDGNAIFNVIFQSKAKTKTFIDGLAASMASIIALASDEIEIAKNGMMMLHSPLSCSCGNAQDMRDSANVLDKIAEALMPAVIDRTGLTKEEVKNKWFDYKDHWLTAEDCLKDKLVDKITEKEGKVPENVANMATNDLFNFYQNNTFETKTLDDVAEKTSNKVIDYFKSVLNINTTDKSNYDMKKIALALNLDEKAAEQAVLDAIKALHDSNASLTTDLATETTARETAENSLTTEQGKVATLTTEKAALETKLAQKAGSSAASANNGGDSGADDETEEQKQIAKLSHNQWANNQLNNN
jgi:ATP-dependent Clp endopeptidase proteolytic subunit ClpP